MKIASNILAQTVRNIISQRNTIARSNIVKTRGNLDFLEVLNSYPEFVEGVSNFNKPLRGRPAQNPAPKEVDYLVFLVEKLYIDNKKQFSANDKRQLKALLNRVVIEGADLFDPVKSKIWIDIFSALDNSLHILNTNNSFAVFFTNYISLYSRINNKKIVPFYARWLKEIAALYTIYCNETVIEFQDTASQLSSALQEGIKSQTRKSSYETDHIRNYIMTNIFMAYGSQKNEVIPRLCNYVRENPNEFVFESGALNDRYRRFYCTIREALIWIRRSVPDYFDNTLLDIFINNNVDYRVKDSKIRELETALVKKLLYLYRLNYTQKSQKASERIILNFFVAPPREFRGDCEFKRMVKKDNKSTKKIEKKYKIKYSKRRFVTIKPEPPYEIAIYDNSDFIDRTPEEVVDCVVKLLRFFIMIIIFAKGIDGLNDFEIPSSEDLIFDINKVLHSMGLLSLPVHSTTSYNEKSLIDLCVLKCIEESFEDD